MTITESRIRLNTAIDKEKIKRNMSRQVALERKGRITTREQEHLRQIGMWLEQWKDVARWGRSRISEHPETLGGQGRH